MHHDPAQLSPRDDGQLAALFRCDRCPFALARETGRRLHEIIAWITLPRIQHAIEAITRLEIAAHRAAAIAALRQTMEKSEDLVEKRRAACAILRALNPGPSRTAPGDYRRATQPLTAQPPARPPSAPNAAPARKPEPSAPPALAVPEASRSTTFDRCAGPPDAPARPARPRTPAALLAQAGARNTLDRPQLDTADLLRPIIFGPDSS